ncbi:hypothetical protein ACQ86N_36535 [Puia sp. P3]|uniref:hypothetical protein n=1 Tax=Puia sp. P3 TaxID=3423952 RepID=UPI003D665368
MMSAPGLVPDSALKGALITTYEAGIDLRFFQNRYGLTINYYNESAASQPVQIGVDAVSGYRAKTINAATVVRRGFEFTLTGNILKTTNFNWNVTATLGYLMNNKVTKIFGTTTRIQPTGWIGSFGTHYASAYQELGKDWGQLIGGGQKTGDGGLPLVNPSTGLYVTGDANYHSGQCGAEGHRRFPEPIHLQALHPECQCRLPGRGPFLLSDGELGTVFRDPRLYGCQQRQG